MQAFQHFLNEQFGTAAPGRWLLAMSGGVDSVVLGHLLHQSGMAFSIAHANFQLRGAESQRDEDFVRQLAADWQVPLHVQRFDTTAYAASHQCSIQVAARQLRYAWFEELALQEGALIATAHHADDSAETLLHHLFRGTGIAGLRGILPRQGRLIRPLIHARKADVLAYARQHGLAWVEDSSNAGDDYTRNAIRHTIMPAVIQVFPQAVPQLQQTAQHLYEAALLYEQAVQQQLRKLVKQQGGEQRVPVLALLKASPRNTLVWEWIKPLQFAPAQVPEVLKLCKA
ncbi:MAG: tRNA lysidine(34) synthetase TilS, partial [Chitinophagaceae bacterium]|nr:tRNA lysidine(34) synthetase TilS [Chitinophagaceae bacterium]